MGVGNKGQKGEPGDKGQKGVKGEVGPGGSDASVPSGVIVAWSGLISAIPSGFVLCNGSNGTPDLRNRFLIGASSDTTVTSSTFAGITLGSVSGYAKRSGGNKDATLVSHSHTLSHTHTFSGSVTGGTHSHTYIDQYVVINNGYRPWPASNNDCAQRNVNTSGSGSHSHSISGTTGNPSNTGTNSQGSSATNANLPPYYALCYICLLYTSPSPRD